MCSKDFCVAFCCCCCPCCPGYQGCPACHFNSNQDQYKEVVVLKPSKNNSIVSTQPKTKKPASSSTTSGDYVPERHGYLPVVEKKISQESGHKHEDKKHTKSKKSTEVYKPITPEYSLKSESSVQKNKNDSSSVIELVHATDQSSTISFSDEETSSSSSTSSDTKTEFSMKTGVSDSTFAPMYTGRYRNKSKKASKRSKASKKGKVENLINNAVEIDGESYGSSGELHDLEKKKWVPAGSMAKARMKAKLPSKHEYEFETKLTADHTKSMISIPEDRILSSADSNFWSEPNITTTNVVKSGVANNAFDAFSDLTELPVDSYIGDRPRIEYINAKNKQFTRSNITPNTGPTRILAGNENNKVDMNFDTVKLVFEES